MRFGVLILLQGLALGLIAAQIGGWGWLLAWPAAVSLLVNGFCQEVFRTLPLEFAVEAVRLLEMKLEDSVG